MNTNHEISTFVLSDPINATVTLDLSTCMLPTTDRKETPHLKVEMTVEGEVLDPLRDQYSKLDKIVYSMHANTDKLANNKANSITLNLSKGGQITFYSYLTKTGTPAIVDQEQPSSKALMTPTRWYTPAGEHKEHIFIPDLGHKYEKMTQELLPALEQNYKVFLGMIDEKVERKYGHRTSKLFSRLDEAANVPSELKRLNKD